MSPLFILYASVHANMRAVLPPDYLIGAFASTMTKVSHTNLSHDHAKRPTLTPRVGQPLLAKPTTERSRPNVYALTGTYQLLPSTPH